MKKMTVEMMPTDMDGLSPEHRALTDSVNVLLAVSPIELTAYDEPSSVERTLAMDFELPYRMNPSFPVNFAEIRQAKLAGAFHKPERPDGFIKDVLRNKAASGLMKVLFSDGSRGTGISRHLVNAMWKHDKNEILEASLGQVEVDRYFMVWHREGFGTAENADGQTFDIAVEQTAAEGTITIQDHRYFFTRTDVATSVSVQNPDIDETYHVSSASKNAARTQIWHRGERRKPLLPGQDPSEHWALGSRALKLKDIVDSTHPQASGPIRETAA